MIFFFFVIHARLDLVCFRFVSMEINIREIKMIGMLLLKK